MGITLWNPWAVFMALGYKTIETRSWATSYRGPLAIHAGKSRKMVGELPNLLVAAGLHSKPDLERLDKGPWCFGAIVAVVNLYDCQPTDDLNIFGPEFSRME